MKDDDGVECGLFFFDVVKFFVFVSLRVGGARSVGCCGRGL